MTTENDRESSAMDRARAEALAALVRATTGHEARTVPVGASFAVDVQVRPQDDGEPGTWTCYDEDDWVWLSNRIGRRAADRPSAGDEPDPPCLGTNLLTSLAHVVADEVPELEPPDRADPPRDVNLA